MIRSPIEFDSIRGVGMWDQPNSNRQHAIAILQAEKELRMIDMANKDDMNEQELRNYLNALLITLRNISARRNGSEGGMAAKVEWPRRRPSA